VVTEQAGGYSDWQARVASSAAAQAAQRRDKAAPAASPPAQPTASPKASKLSYKLQRELENIPRLIEGLERQQQTLEEKVSRADFYQGERATVDATLAELAKVQNELETLFERWAALEQGEG
jgi:ATP-binding cassette subfamily F protein uup